MPFGDFVNQIPAPVFLAIHLTAFLVGASFAWRSFGSGARALGWAFSLFALAELSYMTYHADMLRDGIIARFPAKFAH